MFVPGSDATAFTQIAKAAGQGQIAKSCSAALLLANDVINMIGGKSDGSGDTTVFAAIICCFRNLSSKDNGDVRFTHAFIKRL